mgnify:CR=1 FL=1
MLGILSGTIAGCSKNENAMDFFRLQSIGSEIPANTGILNYNGMTLSYPKGWKIEKSLIIN